MARFLSRTLTLAKFNSNSSLPQISTATLAPASSPISQSTAEFSRRYKSTHAVRAQLIEIEVDSSSDGPEVEVLGLRRLEDAIHNIIVQRSAPSWLVFRPGSSYYVPSKASSSNIAKLVEKLSNPLTEEETLSFTSASGWPSSSYFINVAENGTQKRNMNRTCLHDLKRLPGNGFPEPILKDTEGNMHAQCNDITSKADDEE